MSCGRIAWAAAGSGAAGTRARETIPTTTAEQTQRMAHLPSNSPGQRKLCISPVQDSKSGAAPGRVALAGRHGSCLLFPWVSRRAARSTLARVPGEGNLGIRSTAMARATQEMAGREVRVTAGPAVLAGNLGVPEGAAGVVLFAHGSGSSRFSSRNRYVAGVLRQAGLATLLLDLLTPDEEAVDACTASLRFDIGLLAARLAGATDWLRAEPLTEHLPIGYFGASTGAG